MTLSLASHDLPDTTDANLLRLDAESLEQAAKGLGALPARGPDGAGGLLSGSPDTFVG